ncbi:MAG: 1,6-anhydro-N-acetylmuramyl-L-alanine amidase AmpD [Gammaproteobacteria bacterium]|jgi:AmpD protein
MNIKKHLIENIKFLQSPNFDIRPKKIDISLIVIHSISLPPTIFGNEYVENFFLNKLEIADNEYINSIKDMKVSSHIYIKRTGEIIQFVPFDKRAWHAGESSYKNVKNCNDYSIGIELEGCEDISFEDIQYNKLSEIIDCLIQNYPNINRERIVSHSEIAPGRKSDPGPLFDWKRLKSMIK